MAGPWETSFTQERKAWHEWDTSKRVSWQHCDWAVPLLNTTGPFSPAKIHGNGGPSTGGILAFARAKHRGLYSLSSQGSALTHLTATGSTAVLLHASVSALPQDRKALPEGIMFTFPQAPDSFLPGNGSVGIHSPSVFPLASSSQAYHGLKSDLHHICGLGTGHCHGSRGAAC